MTGRPQRIVVFGLSLSSSWGNGHATTWRALLSALSDLGHDILFLERDLPWYGANRDLVNPAYCDLQFYADVADLQRFARHIAGADIVMVGSFVPDGREVIDLVGATARGIQVFYDIDTPVTLAGLRKDRCDYLAARQVTGFDLYLSFTGGPTLTDIEQQFGAKRARAFYCSVDATSYRRRPVPCRWSLGYLGTYSADRQPALERLLLEPARRLPHLDFVVAGPQYPDDIDWPCNVERILHLPPSEHPAFYSGMRATLNVTRADMVAAGFSPSVRLFEAAACAAPILSDIWPGLGTLLEPGREIELVATSEDVIALLTGPAGKLSAIGVAGQVRILTEHTSRHRADEFMRLTSEPCDPAHAEVRE